MPIPPIKSRQERENPNRTEQPNYKAIDTLETSSPSTAAGTAQHNRTSSSRMSAGCSVS